MAKPEDKTFNSIRLLSERRSSKNQGSIVTPGGIYIGKNIDCGEEIVTNELVIKKSAKIVGDISIGGKIFCQNLFVPINGIYRFEGDIVPALSTNSTKSTEHCLGTIKEPWDMVYAKHIKTDKMDLTMMSIGPNCYGNPSFHVQNGQININDDLNIINPKTNVMMMKTYDGSIEAYVPIYNQWNSVRAVKLSYNPDETLHISSSNILLEIENISNPLTLSYDTNMIPDSTKVKIYFIHKNQLAKMNYKLVLIRFNKKYVFTSVIPVKKIKLFFLEDCVYLIN